MSIVLWEKTETVAVLTMNNKENRQNLDFATAMIKALDEILENKEIFALVIASSDEKNWPQGIDLQWLMEREAGRCSFHGTPALIGCRLFLRLDGDNDDRHRGVLQDLFSHSAESEMSLGPVAGHHHHVNSFLVDQFENLLCRVS